MSYAGLYQDSDRESSLEPHQDPFETAQDYQDVSETPGDDNAIRVGESGDKAGGEETVSEAEAAAQAAAKVGVAAAEAAASASLLVEGREREAE